MEITEEDRKAFEEAVVNMTVTSSPFYQDYVFYMHLLSKCRVYMNPRLPAPAGVSFHNDHYKLHINPTKEILLGKDKQGNDVISTGFCLDMPLAHRIGILKHEMSHIANGHLFRVEDRDFKKYNFASDCALNQDIKRDHLPEYAIYPDNLPSKHKVEWGQTAEYYYDIMDDPDKGCDGNKSTGGGATSPTGSEGRCVDDHEVWKESEGDSSLQKEITKQMVEQAGNQTVKGRGNLPSNYSGMIDNLTITREVDWKKWLRRVVGNKKANVKKTIIKRDRRLPEAFWIKGRIKDRIFSLGVISDVSGSMDDKALQKVWGEIINLCKTFKIPVDMVQIDTDPHPPEPFTANTKKIVRKARGGTILAPAIDMFKKHNINFNALVICTDGGISSSDTEAFYLLNKPVIWLIEPQGHVLESMTRGKMVAVKLK